MSTLSASKRLLRVAGVIVGAMGGGFIGRHAVEQSEMFLAAALFFGLIGALLGLAVVWAVQRVTGLR